MGSEYAVRGSGAPAMRAPVAAGPLLRKVGVGHSTDPFEREADAVADAATSSPPPAGGLVSSEEPDELARAIGGVPVLRRRSAPGAAMPHQAAVIGATKAVMSGGTPLPRDVNTHLGQALGHRFDHVRVHADGAAARASRGVGARAYTVGHHIGFAPGEYAPHTQTGRWLLAHELAHVVQQSRPANGAGAVPAPCLIQRQEAPAVAPAPLLTEAEITAAVARNSRRFSDPWTIATIRELIGIEKYPGVSDRDFAEGIAHWQSTHPPLTVDGKVGPATTRTLSDALVAAGSVSLSDQVRVDHRVSASTVGAVVRNVPTSGVHGLFQLNAGFNTTLRGAWIIQVLRNTWNETLCGGTANPLPGTAHYSEAWWVTNGGAVRLPTSVTTPPTHVGTGAIQDTWQRGLARGTRGNFTMTSKLYAALRLPAGFAIHAVADAGDLPSRAGSPASDDLGLEQGRRSESGRWDGCPGVPNFHTA